MKYKILIGSEALRDIQTAIEWYESQKPGLGRNFHIELKAHIEILRDNPFFQIRYDNVRCLPMKQFPYMIHFTVDQSNRSLIIRAVFNTSLNPENWKKRK